jgi:hypothetical protein
VLTPKIGKSRLGPGMPVRPGPRGGLTRCPVVSLAQRGPGGLTAHRGRSNRVTPISGRIRSLA